MRRLIEFPCAGDRLFGTIDEASGTTGLLIVSGGNEIRIGAHRGMAELAGAVANAGFPVLRFDRRGIGDSTGASGGFLTALPDLVAAAAVLRAHAPQVTRVIGFGNCDAATALALFHRDAGLDALVLANPWVIEAQDDLPPAAAIRARYAERLRDPRAWLRLVSGGVSLAKLIKGLRRVSQSPSQLLSNLADRVASALAASPAPVDLLIAEGDNTAIAFMDAWTRAAFAPARARIRLHRRTTASHSFAGPGDKEWLWEQVIAALRQTS